MLHFLSHLSLSWNFLFMMREEDDDWKITMRCGWWCIYVHTRLWPSSFAFNVLFFFSLSLSLLFVFEKPACAQAHHMCYKRAHPFFFSLLCLTCSIITPILHVDVCARRKKTNRERENERRKEIEYWMCIMKKKRRMLRLTSFFSFLLQDTRKRRCKKRCFFLFFLPYLYVPIIIEYLLI
jgi:hypothetical protein